MRNFPENDDKVLKDLIGVICFVYSDDVIIFSENIEEHIENIKIVLELQI